MSVISPSGKFSTGSTEDKGQASGHFGGGAAHRNRARDLIIHGPAHRGANGAAMPTDETDQDGHFFFNHPERWLLRCLGARSHSYCCLDPIPPTEGGGLLYEPTQKELAVTYLKLPKRTFCTAPWGHSIAMMHTHTHTHAQDTSIGHIGG